MCTPECITEKMGDLAFDEAVKAVAYVCHYKKNLEELEAEMRRLDDQREIIERKVREAEDRGEEVETAVTHWRTDVDVKKEEVRELIGRSTVNGNMQCYVCLCPNIKWRYRLSKQAKQKIVAVKKLTEESHFDQISHPRPRPPELEFPSNENYLHFDSRTPILNAIKDVLRNPKVNIIGVHGAGGIGKTTLVQKVSEQMQKDGTFKQVPMAVVSKDLNVKEIQSKLAENLNFRLDGPENVKDRATQLWNKFTNGEKYLVILDDIWQEVDLKAIGIPITDGKTGCKVVLTSRNKGLLVRRMNVDKDFPITELPEAEAWALFKKMVGNSSDSPELQSVAYNVCEKCKGLPVAINVLGAALKDKEVHVWKTALAKLERYMLTDIEDTDQAVWASLRVSYDMLPSLDAKSCFLICCLFREDAEIPIEDLTRHCVARGLLPQNPRTLDEARNAVLTVVGTLKYLYLASNGRDENVIRMHDVIRGVGISIARKEEAFLVDHGAIRWPRNPKNGPSYSAMSLGSRKIKALPDAWAYPKLHTLVFDTNINGDEDDEDAQLEIPDGFFSGMTELTVLVLSRMCMRRLPSSLGKLPNLRMLYLNQFSLEDIATLGNLKANLELLSLRGSTITALPPEIGNLTSLRMLDLEYCNSLMVIPKDVISKLTSLEELYFPDTFDEWEEATTDKKQQDLSSSSRSSSNNVSLDELRRSLSTGQLTTLHIHIPDVILLPKEGLNFKSLKRFKISVGSEFEYGENRSGTCILKLDGIPLRNELIPLVDRAEVLYLSNMKGLKKLLHDRAGGEGFLNLNHLEVDSCYEELEYLLGKPKSFVRRDGLPPSGPFSKLTELVIQSCNSRYLFSLSCARGLLQLKQLVIRQCRIVEAIVGIDGEEDELKNEVSFRNLTHVKLRALPNLVSFYSKMEKTETTEGSSSIRAQSLFDEKIILPVLEVLDIKMLPNMTEIWDKGSPGVQDKTESFCQLTVLKVCECEKLMNLVPSNILPQLQNLKELVVYGCPNIESIVFKNGKEEEEVADDNNLVIPHLLKLHVSDLENLKSFYTGSERSKSQCFFYPQVAFPALEMLEISGVPNITEIWDMKIFLSQKKEAESFCKLRSICVWRCGELVNLFPSYMLPRLQNLRQLNIGDCCKMEVIVSKTMKEKQVVSTDIIVFPQLREIKLERLENLKSLSFSKAQLFFSNKDAFPVLEDIDLDEDLEILRNGTSVKQESGTSGKDEDNNDHNGQKG